MKTVENCWVESSGQRHQSELTPQRIIGANRNMTFLKNSPDARKGCDFPFLMLSGEISFSNSSLSLQHFIYFQQTLFTDFPLKYSETWEMWAAVISTLQKWGRVEGLLTRSSSSHSFASLWSTPFISSMKRNLESPWTSSLLSVVVHQVNCPGSCVWTSVWRTPELGLGSYACCQTDLASYGFRIPTSKAQKANWMQS